MRKSLKVILITISIIIITVLIILGSIYGLMNYQEEKNINKEREECEQSGRVYQLNGPSGLESWECIAKFNDGGTPCTNSTQCEGVCAVNNQMQYEETGQGECSYNTSIHNCTQSVEDFKSGNSVLCP